MNFKGSEALQAVSKCPSATIMGFGLVFLFVVFFIIKVDIIFEMILGLGLFSLFRWSSTIVTFCCNFVDNYDQDTRSDINILAIVCKFFPSINASFIKVKSKK